jgi:hypothetical protein
MLCYTRWTPLNKKGKVMGALQAREMAELDSISLEQAIEWHLRSNHFPPIPKSMVPVCIEAIEYANEGNFDKLVSLPEGVGYRGLTAAPVYAIVEQHHLDAWIEYEEL